MTNTGHGKTELGSGLGPYPQQSAEKFLSSWEPEASLGMLGAEGKLSLPLLSGAFKRCKAHLQASGADLGAFG